MYVQLNVGLGPTTLKLFESDPLVFLCLSAPSQRYGFKPQNLKENLPIASDFPVACGLKPFLCEGTQKYRGVIFEQLESDRA